MVTCVTVSSLSTPATLTQGCGDSIWSVSHPLFRTWCTLFRENGKLSIVSLKRLFLVEEYNLKRKYFKRIFFSAWACLGTRNASNSKLRHPMPSPSTPFLAPLLGVNSLKGRFCSLYKKTQQGFFLTGKWWGVMKLSDLSEYYPVSVQPVSCKCYHWKSRFLWTRIMNMQLPELPDSISSYPLCSWCTRQWC